MGSLVIAALIALLAVPAAGYAAFPAGECNPATEGGAVVGWGENFHYNLATGYHDESEYSPVSVLTESNPVVYLSNVKQVASGASSSLALLGGCTLLSWGGDDRGQLGNGEEKENQPMPGVVKAIVTEEGKEEVKELQGIKEVVSANEHVVALLNDGTVWTWGASEYGERGNGEKGSREEINILAPRDLAVQVTALENDKVLQVTTGGRRDYALTENTETEEDEVYVWGEDKNKELGVSTEENCDATAYGEKPCVTEPTLLTSLKGKIKSLAAAEWSAYAIVEKPLGEIVVDAWGFDKYGQLGNGETETREEPVEVALPGAGLMPVPLEVAAGKNHAVAVMSDGTAYSWGDNEKGELGHPSTQECGTEDPCSTEPEEVAMPEGFSSEITAASAGANYSLLLDSSGKAYGMGHNDYGKVGIGNPLEDVIKPTEVEGLASITEVAAGNNHSLALLKAGVSGPLPRLSVEPGKESLTVNWTSSPAPMMEYQLRWQNETEKSKRETSVQECPESAECTHTFTGVPSGVEEEVIQNACEFATEPPPEKKTCKEVEGILVNRKLSATAE